LTYSATRDTKTDKGSSNQIRALNVKRKHKIQIFLVITISLLLPLLSAYMDYYFLVEADFLSESAKFENADLDCLLLCEKQKFTALTGFSYAFSIASNLIGHLSCFYYQVTFPQVKTLILRC
jgi:hypothetical protein